MEMAIGECQLPNETEAPLLAIWHPTFGNRQSSFSPQLPHTSHKFVSNWLVKSFF